MAKKKKRHSGGKPAAYAKYQYQGRKLTKAQYEYNEEIRKAFRRIKSWERRLEKEKGVKIQLDLLPSVPPARATKARIREIREITWANLGGRIRRGAEAEAYIRKFIDGISDIDTHFGFNSKWGEANGITVIDWKMKKEAYRDMMLDQIFAYRDRIGEEAFINKLKPGELDRELQRLSWDLYSIPSDSESDRRHRDVFTKFKRLLTGEAASDQELRDAQKEAEMADLYMNAAGWSDFG